MRLLHLFLMTLVSLFFTACSNQYGTIETHTVVSTTNGTSYKIEVLKPFNYDANINYPVIYLLDPFAYLSVIDRVLTDYSDKGLINDVIVVGVGYFEDPLSKRIYDNSYPVSSIDMGSPTGGGELFHTFLRDELVPFIEAKYSSDTSQRTLMGHSIGGFMALYSLFYHYRFGTTPFTNFVAASPSIWYENSYLLGEESATRVSSADLNVTLYMSYGTLEGAIIEGPFIAMKNQILSSTYSSTLRYKTNSFVHGHQSVMPDTIRDSILFLFAK